MTQEERRAGNKVAARRYRANNLLKARASQRRTYHKNADRYLATANRNRKAERVKFWATVLDRPRPEICELCLKPGVVICADHDHETGIYRGWLCNKCNAMLGMAKDNPELLRRAALWIEDFKQADLMAEIGASLGHA